jgi:hypothetical protein
MNEINQITLAQAAAGYQNPEVTAESTIQADGKKEIKGANTYGNPKLSDKAAEYYNSLKKKYGNLNFVLVASDKKQQAEMMKGNFAKPGVLTVLIDTDKIERMANDEKYREKIESTISNAAAGISRLGEQLSGSSSNVTAYGMTLNKDGTASFFAVIDKSFTAQRARIKKKAAEKNETLKANAKKAAKKEAEEQRAEKLSEKQASDKPDKAKTVTITANSIEELMKKLEDYQMGLRADNTMTDDEKKVGQSVNYAL